MTEEHILISLCGTSPAVITETIWALAMEEDDPSIAELPHRIIVLTTTIGAQSIREQLLTPVAEGSPSIWSQLRTSLKQAGFALEGRLIFGDTSEHLKVFSKPDLETGLASPLDDIRTADDQNATADYLLETLRGFTERPRTRITASLAGGRKTMSSLLYGCMSLVGRRDDRLTHVLVSEPYEAYYLNPRFYFPKQLQQNLGTPPQGNGETLLASRAKIELMDVPFVPIRYMFEKQLGSTPAGFQDLVQTYTGRAVTTDVSTPVTLDPDTCTLIYGTETITLSVREWALFHFLATRTLEKKPAYRDYKSGLDDLDAHIKKLKASIPDDDLTHPHRDLTSIDPDDIRKIISSMKGKIKKHGPLTISLTNCLPEKGRMSFDYPPHLIHLSL
jgi:CRISPR-associated protein (TIGR02584 family)